MTTGESPHVPHWEYQLAMKKSGTGDSAVPFSSSGSSPFKVRSMSDIVMVELCDIGRRNSSKNLISCHLFARPRYS